MNDTTQPIAVIGIRPGIAIPTWHSDLILMKCGCRFALVSPRNYIVHQDLRPAALVPDGFEVASAVCDGATAVITVRHISKANPCPGCGASSERVHSRYLRRLSDLPLAGRSVRLVLIARRFRCSAVLCGRRIFTERFDDGVWRHGRGGPPGSTMSSIILDLPWAAAQRRVSPGGSCSP